MRALAFIAVVGFGLLAAPSLQAQQAEVRLVSKDSTKKEQKKVKSGGANVILEEEIEAANVSNALEAIQRLRPKMLQRRAGSPTDEGSAGEIVVYVDNSRLGYKDQLASIEASRIKEIRYLNAADATQRYGTGHTEGVILITTKR